MSVEVHNASTFVGGVLFDLCHLGIELDVLFTGFVQHKKLAKANDICPGIIRLEDQVAQVVGEIVAPIFEVDLSMTLWHDPAGKKRTKLVAALSDFCATGCVLFIDRRDHRKVAFFAFVNHVGTS